MLNCPERILIVDDYEEPALIFRRGFELLTDFEIVTAMLQEADRLQPSS